MHKNRKKNKNKASANNKKRKIKIFWSRSDSSYLVLKNAYRFDCPYAVIMGEKNKNKKN